jgi:hypothetical protein
VRLQFGAQVTHLVRVVLRLGLLIRSLDVLFAGVSRDAEHGVGIEYLFESDVGLAPLTGFLLRFTRLLSLTLLLFLLACPLLLQNARFLFVTRSLSALFLFALALPARFLLLRPEVIRAFRGGMSHRFGGFMPAFLAQVARI